MALQISQVAYSSTNHLLTRTLADIINRKDTGKKIVSSYERNTKTKKNPSIEVNNRAPRKEKHTIPAVPLNTQVN